MKKMMLQTILLCCLCMASCSDIEENRPVLPPDQEQKEDFCLLNASVTYNVAKGLSLWLRGENLLAQSYEINLGYPMPRATFMGGINWNF